MSGTKRGNDGGSRLCLRALSVRVAWLELEPFEPFEALEPAAAINFALAYWSFRWTNLGYLSATR